MEINKKRESKSVMIADRGGEFCHAWPTQGKKNSLAEKNLDVTDRFESRLFSK